MILLPLALLASGCLGSNSGNDAGTQRVFGKRPTYNMPDHFHNMSAVCVFGTLVVEQDGTGNFSQMLYIPKGENNICQGKNGDPPASR